MSNEKPLIISNLLSFVVGLKLSHLLSNSLTFLTSLVSFEGFF